MVAIIESNVKILLFARSCRHAIQFARTMDKNDRIGFRLPAELKGTLVQIAETEGRSLAQICEVLLKAGVVSYRRKDLNISSVLLQIPSVQPSST